MSEPSQPAEAARGDRSVAGRALDVFVFAPAGAFLSALDDVPGMAAKGRERIDRELANARVVGRLAVDFGLRQVREQVESLSRERSVPPGRPAQGAPLAPPRRGARPPAGPAAPPRRARPSTATRDAAVDRAIPEYDTLSASQVVRRLDGLGAADLRAVVAHEVANRGRRTVLSRAEKLLGGPGRGDGSRGA